MRNPFAERADGGYQNEAFLYVKYSHDEHEGRTVTSFLDAEVCSNTCDKWSNAVVAQDGRPHSIAHEPLQDATMKSGELTQAIAGCSDEVGRTADPPSSCR